MLTEEQLIKIILGVLVFVAVILGVYLAFKNYILDFFKNLGGTSSQIFLSSYKMNKKGFLLAEETLKIIIAVIAIGFLAYFLISLYFSAQISQELTQAKSTLPSIINAVDSGKTAIDVYNPKGWALLSWNYKGQIPKTCSNLGWQSCMCICKIPSIQTSDNYLENCDDSSKGFCMENTKDFTVFCSQGQQCQLRILNPPITLNIDQQNKLITQK